MQLIAGCIAQEYNKRKNRKGAFWEDRYHATAIDTGDYLARCMVYIDLNMVRAGVVSDPDDWLWCGYHEIQSSLSRYRIIDTIMLLKLFDISSINEFRIMHKNWISDRLVDACHEREEYWSCCLAVGNVHYVNHVRHDLGMKSKYRTVQKDNDLYKLQEVALSYTSL